MKIFKNKAFHRWAKTERLSDSSLAKAVSEMENGLYEANLGGHIYKKRVAINNRGKRGGARTIVTFKTNDKAIFIYGFSKNKRENITLQEEEALKLLAKTYLAYSEDYILRAIKLDELIEVNYEKIHS